MIPDGEVRLTQLSRTAGCAAKIGPGTLSGILAGLPRPTDGRLLVGIETSDDGAVYQVSEDLAMIHTLDFFTPVVDDPYVFGQVAAANALSDVYAMGGEPKVALNIVAWPNCISPGILGEILAGGAQKVMEAGAVLAGGHSIQDDEPKYGLSVTGFVHPDRIWKNSGARPGDVLILTKPLGTGLINTAVKAGMASEASGREVVHVMSSLNQKAKRAAQGHTVHGCTDVTGFGLAGHAVEMADGSGVTVELSFSSIPIQTGAVDYARMGLIPEGAYRNREYVGGRIRTEGLEECQEDLLFDPQTSGGLLLCVEAGEAAAVLEDMGAAGLETPFAVVGRVLPRQEVAVRVRP